MSSPVPFTNASALAMREGIGNAVGIDDEQSIIVAPVMMSQSSPSSNRRVLTTTDSYAAAVATETSQQASLAFSSVTVEKLTEALEKQGLPSVTSLPSPPAIYPKGSGFGDSSSQNGQGGELLAPSIRPPNTAAEDAAYRKYRGELNRYLISGTLTCLLFGFGCGMLAWKVYARDRERGINLDEWDRLDMHFSHNNEGGDNGINNNNDNINRGDSMQPNASEREPEESVEQQQESQGDIVVIARSPAQVRQVVLDRQRNDFLRSPPAVQLPVYLTVLEGQPSPRTASKISKAVKPLYYPQNDNTPSQLLGPFRV